jgi:hypothetical protein
MKMTRRILIRSQGRSVITISLVCGSILLTPAQARADKISSAETAKALGEIATASALPLSNSSIIDFLHADKPVSATTTTTYHDGTTQTANLLIVPNTSAGTVSITKDINLASGQTEKVFDLATVSGNTVNNIFTRTLPDGSVQLSDEADVTKGTKTTINGTTVLPGGGTLAITGDTVKRGSESITDKTIVGPAGQVYHDRIVATNDGGLSQTRTNTATGPDGATMTVTSVTSAVLNPTAVGQSATQAGLSVPPTGLASPTPNLQAQFLGSSSTANDTSGSVLPAAVPEPGSFVIFAVLLVAALHSRARPSSERCSATGVE